MSSLVLNILNNINVLNNAPPEKAVVAAILELQQWQGMSTDIVYLLFTLCFIVSRCSLFNIFLPPYFNHFFSQKPVAN